LMTFNKGTLWDLIPAPSTDAKNQPTGCHRKEGCSLHLHGPSHDSLSDSFLSSPEAIGIALASGNIGTKLLGLDEGINFYYSRDGGMSWEEVRAGRFIYQIGNRGAIVVAARMDTNATELVFTSNEGDAWDSCMFSSPLSIDQIVTARGSSSRRFLVIGTRTVFNRTKTVLAHINFEGVFSRPCSEENKDFEDWSPTDSNGKCFMGTQIKYRRRKVGVDCFYPSDYKVTKTSQVCQCQSDDYECDHCFTRPTLGDRCVFECTKENITIPEPQAGACDSHTKTNTVYYEADIGYKKIDKDVCIEDKNHSKPKGLISCERWLNPDKDDFLDQIFSHEILIPALVVVGLLILLAGGVLWYCLIQNPQMGRSLATNCGCGEKDQIQEYTLVNTDGRSESALLDGFSSMDDTDLDLDV